METNAIGDLAPILWVGGALMLVAITVFVCVLMAEWNDRRKGG